MIKKRDMESFIGKMGKPIRVNGKMVNNTVLGLSLIKMGMR